MHLELIRDKARTFPQLTDHLTYESATVWHCGYRTLAPLAALRNLRKLEVASWPDATLDVLAGLLRLEELAIVHLPHVSDLTPLGKLRSLRRLSLATLPSWDSSGKVTVVHSLAPIAALPTLEDLMLFGVVPPDRRTDELLRNGTLRRARLSKYPEAEVAKVHESLAKRHSN